jgi:hypothetical protein
MNRSPLSPAAAKVTIARLMQPPRLADRHPLAARTIHAMRLIALHDRVGRDPVPELTARLGGIGKAAKVLAFAQAIKSVWPEDIHISPFCCGLLSHDEATFCSMVEAVAGRDRGAFDHAVEGLVKTGRLDRLWNATSDWVIAEFEA